MKKVLILLLAAALFLTAGCAGPEEPEPSSVPLPEISTSTAAESSAEAATEPQAPTDEPAAESTAATEQVPDTEAETDPVTLPPEDDRELSPEQQSFYARFYELDVESTEAWLQAHPEALSRGYDHLLINETAIGGKGTSIRTWLGEKVLAIDADNEILILEVDCGGSRGVLAIGKQPERLHLRAAANLPSHGDTVGTIARNNKGVLAITGSGFDDRNAEGEAGRGNGGRLCGYAMCDGREYRGDPFGWGYKRLELHRDGWFFIADSFNAVSAGTTDAMEFQPALVLNGVKQNPGIWTDRNPRACIGQNDRGEILMLAVEGRGAGGSQGCSVTVCADVLLTHGCINALNCDGGTTAILWYAGEPIIRCSNSSLPQGRRLPNAWVYAGK